MEAFIRMTSCQSSMCVDCADLYQLVYLVLMWFGLIIVLIMFPLIPVNQSSTIHSLTNIKSCIQKSIVS